MYNAVPYNRHIAVIFIHKIFMPTRHIFPWFFSYIKEIVLIRIPHTHAYIDRMSDLCVYLSIYKPRINDTLFITCILLVFDIFSYLTRSMGHNTHIMICAIERDTFKLLMWWIYPQNMFFGKLIYIYRTENIPSQHFKTCLTPHIGLQQCCYIVGICFW